MTDQPTGFDAALAGLLDEEERPAKKRATASRKRSGPRERATRSAVKAEPRPKREAGQSEQRGARADPEYTQINANIRGTLKASLFYYLKAEKRSLSSVVEELLEAWVDERGGEFVPPARKQ
jgi:hypothetical protein